MELTFEQTVFSEENWAKVSTMIEAHKAEVVQQKFYSVMPKSGYKALWENGLMVFFVALEKSTSRIVGYSVFFLMDIPEWGEPMAQQNAFYLEPSARKWLNASNFIKFCEWKLKQLGFAWVTQNVTEAVDFSPLLKRLGYERKEVIYAKLLK